MIMYNELVKNINILLVDDDEDYIEVTYTYLKIRGYNVDKAYSGKEALEMFSKKSYQILLIDYFMPGMSGEEVINKIRETNKQIIIILQTGFSGQKPPIESMQKLNIQNYHDKTAGIDELNLEIISAVKIFSQQNEIALASYKNQAIGSLISGIANEIKASLMSIGAGLELTNILIKESDAKLDVEKLKKINKYHENNKEYLEKTDKVLTAIINQLSQDKEYDVIKDDDIVNIISLILQNEMKTKGIILDKKVCLKASSYLKGNINEIIFVICEIIRKCADKSKEADTNSIEFVLTEDDNNWIFTVKSSAISKITKNDLYLIKNIVLGINNAEIKVEDTVIKIELKK